MNEQPELSFTIEELRPDDVEVITVLRYESYADAYVNEELGVTRKWLNERNSRYYSPEYIQSWRDRYEAGKGNGTIMAWVARAKNGKIIGFATPFIQPEGIRRVGSLYVAKAWYGKGVGNALMSKVVEWHGPVETIELHVVSYNERAKAFYRKWGFEEVPGSETLFAYKIPEVMMVRKGALS